MGSLLRLCSSIPLLVAIGAAPGVFSRKQTEGRDQLQAEQQVDYYEKWLKEHVVYVITEDEKSVFEGLNTPEEKERFIEQFWLRRDPDPRTPANEFKTEHYRRIAYVNENFHSGQAGWKTDRGRIYIIHGPPTEIEAWSSGGTYARPDYEGGGVTTVLPFERWRYRHIEGVGDDVELEFVDFMMSGEYKLSLHPNDKDALQNIPGVGLMWAEQVGLATKADRPSMHPANRGSLTHYLPRAKDNPFDRYRRFAKVQAPTQITYKDLKEIVQIDIGYSTLPFRVRADYIGLNENQVLVPVTVQVQNKNLSFKSSGDVMLARVAVYGVVTSLTNQLISEFEHELSVKQRSDSFARRSRGRSMYQKILALDRKMRYKIDLVVKDLNSGNIGTSKQALVPPKHDAETLTRSSLILTDFIRPLEDTAKDDEMFVLGDVWIRPSTDRRFKQKSRLGLYLQLYNVKLDQSSLVPSLALQYRILRDGEILKETVDNSGQSIQFFSDRRVVLVQWFDLGDLETGTHQVEVAALDKISGRKLSVDDKFEVVAR